MQPDTEALLLDVTRRLEQAIYARDCPAMIALSGTRELLLSDYDYLRDRETAIAFERRAAEHARTVHARRWVCAVPQVWNINKTQVATRAVSNHPLRDGEHEAITWMAYDAEDGVDYGRVRYVRRPNGEPVFDDPELLTVPVLPTEAMPGHTLLRALHEDDQDTDAP